MSKLILGTAAFGKPYGIKGDPVPDERELERIGRVAWEGGIRTIHTSWQYGVPKICDGIFSEFEQIEKDRINPRLFRCCDQEGWSLYHPDELPDTNGYWAVQVPVNILDGRFMKRNWLRPVKIHARSVFLQGLLLMNDLPSWVQGHARGKIKLFHCVCRREGFEPYEAALGWVLGLDEVDRVIVGVNSARQLEQLLSVKPLKWDYDFSITDELVLDPRKWPKKDD